MLPAVDKLLSRHENTKLEDYVAQLGRRQTPGYQSGQDFIDEVSRYTRDTLGPDLGALLAEELHESPQVLTANHHGIDTFAQSTQSNLLFSLRRRADGTAMKTIPVLACGSVPLNNLTYPRGLLLYGCDDAGADGICRLPIFPDSQKRNLVSISAPFTAEMLSRARSRAQKLVADGKLVRPLGPALNRVFDEWAAIGHDFSGYARQATVVNHRLWRQLLRGRSCRSDLVYIELENIASRLLLRDLFDPSSICHQLFFDPCHRARLIESLDGQRGCWRAEGLSRRASDAPALSTTRGPESGLGTMFFWGVDKKGRKVPLRVAESRNASDPLLCGIDDGGSEWAIAFTADAIDRAIREGRLLPSIFTSYLLISIARGIACIGGYYQAQYLPVMRNAVAEILASDSGAAGFSRQREPDPYLSGMQAVGLKIANRFLPAGPLEIIAGGGINDEQYQRIGEVSVLQSHIASLFDIITDVAPRDASLWHAKSEVSNLARQAVEDEIVMISTDWKPLGP